jgi:hypothetical protein
VTYVSVSDPRQRQSGSGEGGICGHHRDGDGCVLQWIPGGDGGGDDVLAHRDDHDFVFPLRKPGVGSLGNAGLSEHAVTTLAHGGIPDDLSERETIVAHLAHQLSTSHRVDDELYRAAEQAFGTTGLFDIAALMGQYHTVCMALTLFAVPAPN